MDIVIALVFISITLVAGGLLFFFSRLFAGDFEHGDRLSLLPLADDEGLMDEGKPGDKPEKIGSNNLDQEATADTDPAP